MSMIAKNRVNSTWTPLSNEDTNNKIFEERRTLINKWYTKWTHDQKTQVLEDLIQNSKLKQKDFVRSYVKNHIPALRRDFTRHLPRVISIYIFSFLDPKSLCRCSQVSWSWKGITELDQLWMPICVRLGWTLPFVPGQYECGTWKRNYMANLQALQILYPKKNTKIEKLNIQSKKPKSAKPPKAMPWRGSDPVPKDTWRYNYLENDDVVESVNQMRKKKSYSSEGKGISQHARSKVKNGQNVLNTEMRRSQSQTRLVTTSNGYYDDMDDFRPYSTMTNDLKLSVTRPAPVHSPPMMRSTKVQSVMSARTPRDPPSKDLFPKQPWTMPDKDGSDDDL